NLALETRRPVSTNIELAFSRGLIRGLRDANGVFPTGLTRRDVPGKSHHTVDNRSDAGGDSIAFRTFDFERGYARRRLRTGQRRVVDRTENHAPNVNRFTRAVDRFVGSDVCYMPFNAP